MTMTASTNTQAGSRIELVEGAKFWVEIEGILEASFTECTGMGVTTETLEVKEGGLNSYVHRLPVRTSFSNITLKRGFIKSTKFWDWYMNSVKGKPVAKDISIILYSGDSPGTVQQRWTVKGAYPIKWNGPQLNSKSAEFGVETIELVYQYFKPAT